MATRGSKAQRDQAENTANKAGNVQDGNSHDRIGANFQHQDQNQAQQDQQQAAQQAAAQQQAAAAAAAERARLAEQERIRKENEDKRRTDEAERRQQQAKQTNVPVVDMSDFAGIVMPGAVEAEDVAATQAVLAPEVSSPAATLAPQMVEENSEDEKKKKKKQQNQNQVDQQTQQQQVEEPTHERKEEKPQQKEAKPAEVPVVEASEFSMLPVANEEDSADDVVDNEVAETIPDFTTAQEQIPEQEQSEQRDHWIHEDNKAREVYPTLPVTINGRVCGVYAQPDAHGDTVYYFVDRQNGVDFGETYDLEEIHERVRKEQEKIDRAAKYDGNFSPSSKSKFNGDRLYDKSVPVYTEAIEAYEANNENPLKIIKEIQRAEAENGNWNGLGMQSRERITQQREAELEFDDAIETAIERKRRRTSEKFKQLREIRKQMRYLFQNAYLITIDGTTYEKRKSKRDGITNVVLHLPEEAQKSMEEMKETFGVSTTQVFQMVICRMGLGIDSKGNIANTIASDFVLSEYAFCQACDDMIASQAKYGHPFALLSRSRIQKFAKTNCYPMGYIPKSLRRALVKGPAFESKNMREDDLAGLIYQTWMSDTYRAVIANTSSTTKRMSQRWAIFNMHQALMELDQVEDKMDEMGITRFLGELTLEQYMDEAEMFRANGETDLAEASRAKAERFERELLSWARQYYDAIPIKDDSGHIAGYDYRLKNNLPQKVMQTLATVEKTAGVAGSLPLFIANELEHVNGSAVQFMANRMYGHNVDRSRHSMTESLKQIGKTGISKDTFVALRILAIDGDRALLDEYSRWLANREGETVSKKSIITFLGQMRHGLLDSTHLGTEHHSGENIVDNGSPEYNKKRTNAAILMDRITNAVMPGNIGMGTIDTLQYLDTALLNMAISEKNGKANVSSAALERLIQTNGIEKTMLDLMLTNEGWDAFLATQNMNGGRISPLTTLLRRFLRTHGVTQFVLMNTMTKYMEYGLTYLQLTFPFSNTFNYLVLRGVHSEKFGIDFNGVADRDAATTMVDYQLGGNDEYLDGLKKNLMYDLSKIGNVTTIALFWAGFCLANGINEPPEEEDRYNWLSWLVGGRLNLPAWWLNDLSCWGLPAGTAIAVAIKTGDLGISTDLFLSGMGSMLSGTTVSNLVVLATHGPEEFTRELEKTEGAEFGAAPDVETILKGMAIDTGWSTLDAFIPAGIKMFLPGATPLFGERQINKSASKLFDTVSYDNEEARKGEHLINNNDYIDVIKRKGSRHNLLEGIYYNFASGFYNVQFNGFPIPSITTDLSKTGYTWNDMPNARWSDAVALTYQDMFSYDVNSKDFELTQDENGHMVNAALDEKCEALFTYLLGANQGDTGAFSSPEDAAAHSFVFFGPLRNYAKGWAVRKMDEVDQLKKEWKEKKSEIIDKYKSGDRVNWTAVYADPEYQEFIGEEAEDKEAWFTREKNRYNAFLYNYLGSDAISSSASTYYQKRTDYYDVIKWKDSDKAAPAWAYILMPWATYKETRPYGNDPAALLPFTQVKDEDITGYNFETISSWYTDGWTDNEKVISELGGAENGGGAVVPMGADEGNYAVNTAFGAEDDTSDNTNLKINPKTGTPTSNHRALIPMVEKTEYFDIDAYRKECAERAGKTDKDKDPDEKKTTTNGGGGSYGGGGYGGGSYSGSGGSSGYNPKIYSTNRSISSRGAAGMNTSAPFHRNTTYLRPDVQKQGSRNAYKRSDM